MPQEYVDMWQQGMMLLATNKRLTRTDYRVLFGWLVFERQGRTRIVKPFTQQAMAQKLRLTQGRVSASLKRLCAEEIIERWEGAEDGLPRYVISKLYVRVPGERDWPGHQQREA